MPKRNEAPINTGFTNIDRLLNSNIINRTELARRMYPTNKQAGQYLYKKLNRLERQSFTTEDRNKLETIIRSL